MEPLATNGSKADTNNIINRVDRLHRGPVHGRSAQMNSNVPLGASVGATRQDSERDIVTGERKCSVGP